MLGGMPVFGIITTPDVPALQAHPEVDPSITQFDAFLAEVRAGLLESSRFEVFTQGHTKT